MSDHLPECEMHGQVTWDYIDHTGKLAYRYCICDRLRACEQRVLSVAGPHNYSRGRKDGYVAALDEAREAIAAMVAIDEGAASRDYLLGAKDALASIDGLIWRNSNE